MAEPACVRSILALTDFSEDARVAFEHALRLAVALRADLYLLDLEPNGPQPADAWVPPVLETLVRWGFLPEGAVEGDLASLGVRLDVSVSNGAPPLDAIVAAIQRTNADLVVMATHGRSGAHTWHGSAVTVQLAERGVAPLLYFPPHHKGFVNRVTGESQLHRVLVPTAVAAQPAPVLELIDLLARALPAELCVATLQPEGGPLEAPWADVMPGWRVLRLQATDDMPAAILDRSAAWNTNLIVCAAEAPRPFFDALRDSPTKRLLDDTSSPVLIVPHAWRAELAVA